MEVKIDPEKGRPFSIEVDFFDCVLEIKEKIQKYQGIPIFKQTLILNGLVLRDDDNVPHGILQDSHIQLIVSPEIDKLAISEIENSSTSNIRFIVKMPISKNYVILEMDVYDTIGQLKEKIQEMEAVPTDMSLVIHSSDAELQDYRSLHDCEISDGSNIDVSLRSVSPTTLARPSTTSMRVSDQMLKLLIWLPSCETSKIPLELNEFDRVGDLRNDLQKLQQIQHFDLPEEYFFIHKQEVMEDDKTFRWHHVEQGDTIEVFPGHVTHGPSYLDTRFDV